MTTKTNKNGQSLEDKISRGDQILNVATIDRLDYILSLLRMINSVRMDELCPSGINGVHITLQTAIDLIDELKSGKTC